MQARAASRSTGSVKWFDPAKGYGFIVVDGGSEAFFHGDDCAGQDYPRFDPGDRVAFDLESRPRGLRARRVVPMKGE